MEFCASETGRLEFIGRRLRAIQSLLDARQIEIELSRKELGRFAGAMITREMLNEVVQVLAGRIGSFEALMEARMIQVESRMDRPGARMDRLEARIGGLDDRICGLETTVENGIAGLQRSNQDVIQLLTRGTPAGTGGHWNKVLAYPTHRSSDHQRNPCRPG
jgi:hypothetical protein